MANDAASDLERAYPYRSGWRVIGCGFVLFGLIGGIAAALIPLGYEQVQAGRMPIGVAMLVVGAFGTPLLVMAAFTVIIGIRERIHPPLLRVTPTSLLLPASLRGDQSATDREELAEGTPAPPVLQPEEIPFRAIRWVRREGPINPGSHKLLIVHDLVPATLVIEQNMMQPGDFDELELVLRAAIPAAFAAAPPPSPSSLS
jgi:hypothetical protein